MESLIFETAIGLIFVFATFAALVSMGTEGISRFIGLRGEYLLRGIRSLVDGKSDFKLPWRDLFRKKPGVPSPADHEPDHPMVTRIMNHPMVASSGAGGSVAAQVGNAALSWKQRLALPSYVSSRSFAIAVIDLVVPDGAGRTTFSEIENRVNNLDDGLKKRLLPIVKQADGDVAKLRTGLEQWYDDHMARVSGWYKRHVRWIALALAGLVAVICNVNAVEIARSLYTDEALRASVVAQATEAADCGDKEPDECLEELRAEIGEARDAGLPVGWGIVEECTVDGVECGLLEERGVIPVDTEGWANVWAILLLMLGWLVMAVAAVPGSRFWFDALSKLGSLRSTGPKPASSTE